MIHDHYLQRGGEDAVFEVEVNLLRSSGHSVETYEEHNEKVEMLGTVRTAARSIYSIETYRIIRALLRRNEIDVVHVHNFFPLISPSVYYAAQAEDVPVVQTLHNYRLMCPVGTFNRDGRVCEDCLNRFFPWPGVVHRCYRDNRAATLAVGAMTTFNKLLGTWRNKVDAYIVLTEFMRQKFIEGGLPPAKLHVKPNFLDPDPLPGTGGGNFALFAGRLSKEKGIATLLKAWERVGDRMPLKIAGTGPLEPMVREAVARIPSIEYVGWLSSAALLQLMGEADLFVLPTEFYEGHPRSAVEAFARQVPVVASRIGAMQEMVEDGETGFLFTPGDADDLVNSVNRALSDNSRLAEVGRRARKQFEAKYSASQNRKMLQDIYASVLRSDPMRSDPTL
jgi:glycosyltransferase involved in cell wall biosynthesis